MADFQASSKPCNFLPNAFVHNRYFDRVHTEREDIVRDKQRFRISVQRQRVSVRTRASKRFLRFVDSCHERRRPAIDFQTDRYETREFVRDVSRQTKETLNRRRESSYTVADRDAVSRETRVSAKTESTADAPSFRGFSRASSSRVA